MAAFPGGLARARELMQQHFGHARLRVHQIKVLAPLLAGRSVLGVLPTGAGKSLCYQLPALMAEGMTLVISPLIALMQDQVAALRGHRIRSAYLSSLLSPQDRGTVLAAVARGRVRVLYCAPERLATLVPALRAAAARVALLAVDEAHCIVEWGNEFRPVYRRLGEYRYRLGNPVTLAVTGSATPSARAEIVRVLRMPNAEVVVTSFDRPNLSFAVARVRDDRERFALIRERVRGEPGHVVVYTPTRRLTELVTRALLRVGVAADPYHAGLTPDTRRHVLLAFLRDQVPVVVATSAFGMGIDKADVRRVIHWGPARTLEAYYQEAGRAGRDGRPAECLILWRPSDLDWTDCDVAMRRYLTGRGCRRRMLLAHFGEVAVPCAGCDRCGLDLTGGLARGARGEAIYRGRSHPFQGQDYGWP